jgi:hypothetical protein
MNINKMKLTRKYIKNATALLAIALVSIGLASAANAATDFNYTFDLYRASGYANLGTSPNPTIADSFYRLDSTTTWSWGGWGAYGQLYTQNIATSFAARDLHSDDLLDKDQSLDTFNVSIQVVGNDSYSNREGHAWYIGMLNENGGGYIVEITRGGDVTLSAISGGVSGSWTQLKQGSFNPTLLANSSQQTISLAFDGTSLSYQTVKYGTDDVAYSSTVIIENPVAEFSTVIVGSKLLIANQTAYFREITVSGTVIPEPASFAAFAGILIMAAVSLRNLLNRKR